MLANTLVTLIVFVILAVKLGPRAIGLVSMAMVFVALATRVTSDEIADGLLRKVELDDLDQHTMFWLASSLGALTSLCVFLLANPIARLFGEPSLAAYIQVLAGIPFLNSLSSVPKTLLRRHFQFKTLAVNSLLVNVLAGSTAIAWALTGGGAWSLILFYLLLSGLMALSLWVQGYYVPRFRFAGARAAPLFSTAYMMGNVRLLAFIEEHMPRILLGLFVGAHALGLFMMAWNINVGIRRLTWTTLSHVLASASAEIHRVRDIGGRQMQQAVDHAMSMPGTLVLPVYVGFAAIAPELFSYYFSPEWSQSGTLARYLSIGFACSILYMIPLELLRGAGQMQWLLGATAMAAVSATIMVMALAPVGVDAAAIGMSIHFVLMTLASLLLLRKALHVRVLAPLLGWLRVAAAAIAMATVVRCILVLSSPLPPYLSLSLGILSGVLTYWLFAWMFARSAMASAWHLLQRCVRERVLLRGSTRPIHVPTIRRRMPGQSAVTARGVYTASVGWRSVRRLIGRRHFLNRDDVDCVTQIRQILRGIHNSFIYHKRKE